MIGLSIASDRVRDWCEFVGPLIQQSEGIPMHWMLSWKFPYLAGHFQLEFKSMVFQIFSSSQKLESQDWITWRLCYQPTGAHPLQFPLFQNRIWQRRIRIWKCMRKKSFVEGRQWRQKYQGIWIHFPLFKTLNCSAPGKSCMQHGVMIML